MYAVVPSGVALTFVNLEPEKTLVLKGQALSMSDVLQVVSALEKPAMFHNVQIRYANNRRFKAREIADFEIQCNLLVPPAGGAG